MSESKKAFDFSRGNMYVVDPLDVRIVGGLGLPPQERGPLDTDADVAHPLYDPRLDKIDISDEEVANTDAFGVIEAIEIAKYDEVATVVNGRTRIRRARLVNIARKKRGEPALKVNAILVRGDDTRLMGVMLTANALRHVDDPLTVIENARRYQARGVAIEDISIVFGKSVSTIKQLLAYDENATPEVKAAVEAGAISQSAGAELARARDPEKQREALTSLIALPGPKSARAAKKVAKKAKKGKDANVGVTDKRTLRKLLEAIENKNHKGNTSEKTLAWWQGVEDALKLATGDGDLDERLVSIMAEVA